MTHNPLRLLLPLLLATTLAGAGCHSAPYVPLSAAPAPEPLATLLWVGHGTAERNEGGRWVRIPEFDYEFSVEQRRYADHWESIKSLRRHHPGYDKSAGPRDQTLYFSLSFAPRAPGVEIGIQSSLGKGRGHTDPEFRKASLELAADVSRFAPFDRYRIDQHYDYERGALQETVQLLDGDKVWVRNTEEATLFAPHAFEAPPTQLEVSAALDPLDQAAR